MERYKEILRKSGVENWIVKKSEHESVELFFIKKRLDMRRIKNIDVEEIAVFKDEEKDGNKFRGRADVIVNSSMSDEEILAKITDAEYAAGFALNPYYDFPKPITSDTKVLESDLNKLSLEEIASEFVDAAYSVDNDERAFINSFELFVKEDKVHIINALGTDVSYVKRSVKGEFVAQCKEPEDVETYQDFEYDSLALDEIKNLVKTTLKMTKDRAVAKKTLKSGKMDVIISDKYMPTIFSFYVSRAHAAYVYIKYSDYEVGKFVQGENVTGDKLNLRFGVSVPFSDDGIEMAEREFIKEGELMQLHGSARFCRYLGIEPVGEYDKVILPSGKVSFEELKNRPCLHIVNFSDFQMDPLDGHFASEIRLAYLYDGKGNVTPVTGGSINGSIFDCQKEFVFSKETQKLSNYTGPKACLFKNVSVAGED